MPLSCVKNQRPLLILFIHLGLGGVQRKIVDIVNFLASYRPDLPIFIILRNREKFDLIPEIKNKKVRIINYKDYQEWKRIKIPFFFPFFIIGQIWRLKPAAILAFLDFVSLPAIWAKLIFFWRKNRLVLSEDHYTSKIVPTFAFGRFRNFLIKIFYRFADAIFVCSRASKKDLTDNYGLDGKKIKIIRNWTVFSARKTVLKKRYHLIYFGRFEKTKRLDFLIKALKEIKKKENNVRLCLLGDGKEKENLVRMANLYHLEKNVDFVSPIRGVEDFLAKSKIFVYCSQIKAEGFPMAILEAMATKTPVLTNNFAGAEDFLAEGENCYFFHGQKEFVDKTLWLLKNPVKRKALAAKAYQYVKRCHSSKNILDYLQELNLLKEPA